MIRPIRIVICYLFIPIFCLSACNTSSTRIKNGQSFAIKNQFIKQIYRTSLFSIVSFKRTNKDNQKATVYIEGDGKAWLSKRRISDNPTPDNPIALKLAAIDNSPNVIYLARPCQFINLDKEPNCSAEYWTNKRASREIIDTYHQVLEQIKNNRSIKEFRLVGYSGGGTIAAILSAERQDIIDLRTIAGNLDIELFANIHLVSPLSDSINPIDMADKLFALPQIHFYSHQDKVIPPIIIQNYQSRIEKYNNKDSCILIKAVNNTSHQNGWVEKWEQLNQKTVICRNM